jgi:NADPH:quinone reductase-like Zn-dependent oxidoreductase
MNSFATFVRALLISLASLPVLPAQAADVDAARVYRLQKQGEAGYRLQSGTERVRAPGAGEVLVRVRATSLNRRDLSILRGQYGRADYSGRIPLSDGAGEVVAVGPGVTRWKAGDRVMATFFANWADGRPPADRAARGGEIDGLLADRVVLNEDGLVRIPEHLSFEQAATLPCAGLTAWNGLTRPGLPGPDHTVLVQGTGGVSIFGLQIARAFGSRVAITSSSDAKLSRARELGASILVNYRTTPEWQQTVLQQTGGVGADRVLEVGGRDTLPRALAALAPGGHVALIGGLGGFGGDVPAIALLQRSATAGGISVGSRAEFERFAEFVAKHRLVPVVDRMFTFDDAPAAYELMASGDHFGKIVIRH